MGLELIQWLQSWGSPWLDRSMLFVTKLGEEDFYLLFGPIIFWCFGLGVGVRLLLMLLTSFYVNDLIKDLVAWPRPVAAYPEAVRLPEGAMETAVEDDGTWESGFPSGHAQNAVVFWGFLAHWARRRWAAAAVLAIILLIGVSRLYLGVHWPIDIAGGWLIGLIIFAGFAVLAPAIVERARDRRQPLLLVAVLLGLVLFLVDQDLDRAKILGFWSGAAGGLLLERSVPFRVRVPLWQQVAKLAVGLAGVFLLRAALKAGLPPAPWANWLRYAAVAAWVVVGAPAIFRLMLGPREVDLPSEAGARRPHGTQAAGE